MALNIEQIAEAAQSLRDDPTFPLMGAGDRRTEAKFLVDVFGGDAADVQAVVDWASGLDATPPARGAQFRPHIPAQAALAVAAPERPVTATPPMVAVASPRTENARPAPPQAPPRTSALGKLPPDLSDCSGFPLLHQIKAAGGGTERDFSAILGVPRSTIQAYLCGRIAESYTESQYRELASYVERAETLLADAKRSIAKSLQRYA